MFNYLQEIDLMRKREKQAIIALVGKAPHVLIGMITEGDLKLIKERLSWQEGTRKT